MSDLVRSFSVYADDEPVTGWHRARLSGREAVGLLPLPFTLRLWNLGDPDYFRLCAAGSVSVVCDGSVLAFGRVSDVYRRSVPEGTVCEVVFSPGLDLWEAPVSLGVGPGTTVSDTVEQILEASGTGIPLLSVPDPDPVRARGQSFFGRAAECLCTALSAAGSRAYLTRSGLCILPPSGLPVTLGISEQDLIDRPVVAGDLLVLRTRVIGWPLGKKASVKWNDQYWEGIIVERSVEADTLEGNWQAELIVEICV